MVRGSRPEKVKEWSMRLDRYESSGHSVEHYDLTIVATVMQQLLASHEVNPPGVESC